MPPVAARVHLAGVPRLSFEPIDDRLDRQISHKAHPDDKPNDLLGRKPSATQGRAPCARKRFLDPDRVDVVLQAVERAALLIRGDDF